MIWTPFIAWMTHEYRETTVKQYWIRCRRFIQWAGLKEPSDLKSLKPETFLEYDTYLKESGVTQRSTHGFAIRSMLQYYGLHDLVGKVPARREWVQKPPKWLPLPVVNVMLDYAPDLRVKSLAAVGYDLALRVHEALALNVKLKQDKPSIDLETGTANVYRLKTKQYPWNTLRVSDWALKILREYVEQERHPVGDALFTTMPYHDGLRGGGRMSVETAERLWSNFMKALRLDPHTWVYQTLRHSKLTWMAVEGKDLIEIAKFAGHANPASTLIYMHLSSMWLRQPKVFLEEFKDSKLYEPMTAILSAT